MEKSMAEGSQSFEQDLARLIVDGLVSRNEGLAHADSPNNLMWRLQNDFNASKSNESAKPSEEDHSDSATFTEFTLDVKF
jgi:twitching motility protein PilU